MSATVFGVHTMNEPGLKKRKGSLGSDSFQWFKLEEEKTAILRKENGRVSFVRLPFERVDQSGQEASIAFPLCGAVATLTAPQAGVEQIPHGVSEHVEAENDDRQAKPWPERSQGAISM